MCRSWAIAVCIRHQCTEYHHHKLLECPERRRPHRRRHPGYIRCRQHYRAYHWGHSPIHLGISLDYRVGRHSEGSMRRLDSRLGRSDTYRRLLSVCSYQIHHTRQFRRSVFRKCMRYQHTDHSRHIRRLSYKRHHRRKVGFQRVLQLRMRNPNRLAVSRCRLMHNRRRFDSRRLRDIARLRSSHH